MDYKIIKSFVIATLRRASYRWPPRYNTLNAARVERGLYRCNLCKKIVRRKEIKMDHIHPIVPTQGWDGWDGFIERLFCDQSGFQAICKPCHDVKTKGENALRKKNKKK